MRSPFRLALLRARKTIDTARGELTPPPATLEAQLALALSAWGRSTSIRKSDLPPSGFVSRTELGEERKKHAESQIYWAEDEYDIKQEEVPVERLERASTGSSGRRTTSTKRTPHSPGKSSRRLHKGKRREEPPPSASLEQSIQPVPPGTASPDALHRERPVCLVRGSIFIEDYIELSRHATPGETVTSRGYTSALAGKGVIQAIAISRAGQRVELAGAIGADGDPIPSYLTTFGIGTSRCRKPEVPPGTPVYTGRIVKQFTHSNDCAKVIVPGANYYAIDSAEALLVPPITHLVLQNETDFSVVAEFIDVAHDRGIVIIFNPSPIPHAAQLHSLPWQKVDYLILSEEEAELFVESLPIDPQLELDDPGGSSHPRQHSEGSDVTARRIRMYPDSRIESGQAPPMPKQAYKTFFALTSWSPLSRTGIIMKLRAPGGGALAVLPFAHAQNSNFFYEPAPLRELALGCPAHTSTGSPGSEGSVDAILGYFVAGLMEFSLFDRSKLDDHVWKDMLEKAVTASFMTPTGFPPTPPIPLYAIPHYPEVHRMMSYLRTCYMRQQMSHTSIHPFIRADYNDHDHETRPLLPSPERSPLMIRPRADRNEPRRRISDVRGPGRP